MEKATFKNYKISAKYKGDKVWNLKTSTGRVVENWNNHTVTVTNTETGKQTRFDFWTSIMYPRMRTENDILEAFQCFLDEALSYIEARDEWDFYSEFGYTPSREAHKVWLSCKRQAEKAKRLVGNVDDLYELSNALREKEEEIA